MPSQDQNHDSHESSSLPDFGDAIDMNTFGQILEMDDSEDDRDFSQGIVFDFFEQVQETFEKMDAALGVIRPGNSQRSQKAHPCHQHARGSVLGSGRPTDDTRYDSEAKDLSELYRLGHFLKGSSATLGLTKVKDSCEKIQRYGKKENLDGSPEPNEELCLSRVTETLAQVKLEFAEAEKTLQNFYRT